jgi:hypothetical protein
MFHFFVVFYYYSRLSEKCILHIKIQLVLHKTVMLNITIYYNAIVK